VLKTRNMIVEDVPKVVPLLEEFFYLSKMGLVGSFNKLYVSSLLNSLLGNPSAFLHVACDKDEIIGVLIALAAPSMFDEHLECYEQVWFVDKKYRGTSIGVRLLYDMNKWAKETGCKYVSMGSAEQYSEVEKMYEKLGLIKINSTFMGVL